MGAGASGKSFLCKENETELAETEAEEFNLLGHALLDRHLAGPLAVVSVETLRTHQSVAQRIAESVGQRPTLLDNAADEDILPGSSNSGCMISLMAHFRLHLHYKELQDGKREGKVLSKADFSSCKHNFPRQSFNFPTLSFRR